MPSREDAGADNGIVRAPSQKLNEREAVMVDTNDPASNLRELRDSIDNIDAAIVHMLAERFRCTRAIGKLKAQHSLPSQDPERAAEQISRLRHLAAVSKLDPDFAEKFLAFVSGEVIRHHELFPRNHRRYIPG